MKKNIEALWMGRPIPPSFSDEDQEIFNENVKKTREALSAIERQLTVEERKLLREYMSLQASVNDMERKNAFVYGFSLAVKLMSEGLNE